MQSRGRTCAAAIEFEGVAMSLEYLIGGVIGVLLTIYLLYALIRPERF